MLLQTTSEAVSRQVPIYGDTASPASCGNTGNKCQHDSLAIRQHDNGVDWDWMKNATYIGNSIAFVSTCSNRKKDNPHLASMQYKGATFYKAHQKTIKNPMFHRADFEIFTITVIRNTHWTFQKTPGIPWYWLYATQIAANNMILLSL